ncbi:RCC1-like G exchanging factor-like protein [Macrosteles quadrilineatus]|uniref:RCC1-like G exchanging factor-like protein n=1 Tax=Macrosteles quadrilineatus TaxID=74068 RepID=UPI0023E1F7C2|nr:RCC1-like G exchanging factor-like protein [Macrosteles quadrilineatus]
MKRAFLQRLTSHPSAVDFRSLSSSLKYNYKRVHPIDRDAEFDLPVFQYPPGSSSDRRVYVWGLSEHGALGNRLQLKNTVKYKKKLPEFHHKPLRLTFAEQNKVTDIACGYGFTLFAVDTKEKYKVFGSGINTDSQIGYHDPRRDHPLNILTSPAPIELPLDPTTKVKGLAAGRAHSVVLTDTHGVFTFGNNAYGQCGRRIVENEKYSGSRIVHNIPNIDGNSIVAVVCGQDHTLMVTEGERGGVYSCGWGADGQLGRGDYNSQWQIGRVGGDIASERITKLAGTGDCVLALNDKGEVFGWGNNEYRQLSETGDLQQVCTPVRLESTRGLGKIIDIAAGGSFCAVLNEEGAVFVWGYGLLGLGPQVDMSPRPLRVPETLFGQNMFMPHSRVDSLASGLYYLAAITNQGQLYMWGRNKSGCLGIGSTKDQYFPLKVNVGAHVLKVSAGVDHTIALCKPFT